MAYRNDVEAMEARLAHLEGELADRTQERDEVARLIADTRNRERREALLADLRAGGPERRLRQRAMITFACVAVAVVGVLGYRALQHDDRLEKTLEQFEAFTDAMCKCTDQACTQKVNADLVKWSQEMSKEWSDQSKPDEAMMKRMSAVGTRLGECMSKAMSAN